MTRPAWRRALAAAAGLLLLTAAPVPAQDEEKEPPSPAFLQGTEAFRRIIFDAGKELSKDGFQPLKTFNDLDDPQHTILIVFGDARRLAEVPGGLKSFVQRGGALFLATDRALPTERERRRGTDDRVHGVGRFPRLRRHQQLLPRAGLLPSPGAAGGDGAGPVPRPPPPVGRPVHRGDQRPVVPGAGQRLLRGWHACPREPGCPACAGRTDRT